MYKFKKSHMRFKSKAGLTLVELLVAIAIFGIVFIAFQDMFFTGFRTIFTSGQRTQAIMEVETLSEDIAAQPFDTQGEITAYATTAGYHVVGSIDQLTDYAGYAVNCYVSDLMTLNDVTGYRVSLVLFFSNRTQYVQLTTFIIADGA